MRPARPSSRSPPKRRPLHQRSESERNEIPIPSIRLVNTGQEPGPASRWQIRSSDNSSSSTTYESRDVSDSDPVRYQSGVTHPLSHATSRTVDYAAAHPTRTSTVKLVSSALTPTSLPTSDYHATKPDAVAASTPMAKSGREAPMRDDTFTTEPTSPERASTAYDSSGLTQHSPSASSPTTTTTAATTPSLRPESVFLRRHNHHHLPSPPQDKATSRASRRDIIVARDATPSDAHLDSSSSYYSSSLPGSVRQSFHSRTGSSSTLNEPTTMQVRQPRPTRTVTASYSAFPPVSPPPVPIHLPPPVPYPLRPAAGTVGGSPTSAKGPVPASFWPRPITPQPRSAKSTGPIALFSSRDRASSAPTAKSGSPTYPFPAKAPNGLRMNQPVLLRNQMWESSPSSPSPVAVKMSRDRLDQDSSDDGSPQAHAQRDKHDDVNWVGIAVSSDPGETAPVTGTGQQARRASTIRIVSGLQGLDDVRTSTYLDDASDGRQKPPARLPARQIVRKSVTSAGFPDWAR